MVKRLAIRGFLFSLCLIGNSALFSQTPFICQGEIYAVLEGTNELVELVIDPSNNAIQIEIINNLGNTVNAIGFRKTDRLLYGLNPVSFNLFRIDRNGNIEDLANLSLNNTLLYLAGAVSPNGNYLYAIGSLNGVDQEIARIDLQNGFAIQTTPISGQTRILDIVFHPYNNRLYGYDRAGRTIVEINPSTGNVVSFQEIQASREIQSVYFDSFGELWAFGSSQFGVASAIFSIDQATGEERSRANGPVYLFTDMAGCPYTVAVNNEATPNSTFPCSEINYIYAISNASGAVHTGLNLEHQLPPGFTYLSTLQNPFGGIGNNNPGDDVFRLEGVSIPGGVDSIIILVEVDDIPGDKYHSQAILEPLPSHLGDIRLSNDPVTMPAFDSTAVDVLRLEDDSLGFLFFLCIGEELILDASDFGNNLTWNTGATSPELLVTQQGNYVVEATSGCQMLTATYEVTSATCPFTIALSLEMVPGEALACNEVLFRYILENDSGLPREGLSLENQFPEGFTYVNIESNPFAGILNVAVLPQKLEINDLTLPPGSDTLDVLMSVENIPPGIYRSRAKLSGLPFLMGPNRFSFDPIRQTGDSTEMTILGVPDSSSLEFIICPGDTLILDGSLFGSQFLWDDGSTNAQLHVTGGGEYMVTLLGACEPYFAFFSVIEGSDITVDIPQDIIEINQGEIIELSPLLTNLGDSVTLNWFDPFTNSLSCTDCLETIARPLESTTYFLSASNGLCSAVDSVEFIVDVTRRVFAPNVFTPNYDGINDVFYLQSPDFGTITRMHIFDRWGVRLFSTANVPVNEKSAGWDGMINGEPIKDGVYVWIAEIEFVDGSAEQFFGDITVLK